MDQLNCHWGTLKEPKKNLGGCGEIALLAMPVYYLFLHQKESRFLFA